MANLIGGSGCDILGLVGGNMNERRMERRIDENLGIAVSVMAEEGSTARKTATIYHVTRDVSTGGLRFDNDHALAPETLLRVHVALSSPLTTITRHGRVKWCLKADGSQPFSIGVQFTDHPENEERVWSNFMESRLSSHMA